MVQNPPATQETQIQSLGQEDPLEKEMSTHWEIPWQRNLVDYRPWGCKSQIRFINWKIRIVFIYLSTVYKPITYLCSNYPSLVIYNQLSIIIYLSSIYLKDSGMERGSGSLQHPWSWPHGECYISLKRLFHTFSKVWGVPGHRDSKTISRGDCRMPSKMDAASSFTFSCLLS